MITDAHGAKPLRWYCPTGPSAACGSGFFRQKKSFLIIRYRLSIIPACQSAQDLQIDGYRQQVNAAIAEDELAKAWMVAAEDGQLFRFIVEGRGGQRGIGAGRTARGRRVVAGVDRAVQPTDAEATERHVLLAHQQGVAQAVDDFRETNALTS